MTNLLRGLAPRDWFQIGSTLVGLAVAGLTVVSKVDRVAEDLTDMKVTVNRIDDRLWQLQGSRSLPATLIASPEPCPADATFVALNW